LHVHVISQLLYDVIGIQFLFDFCSILLCDIVMHRSVVFSGYSGFLN